MANLLSLYFLFASVSVSYYEIVHGSSLCIQTPYSELCKSFNIPNEEVYCVVSYTAPIGFPTTPLAPEGLLQQGVAIKADIVVAQDGSGNYTTISEALASAKRLRNGTGRFVIYVRRGIYREYVEIKKSMKNMTFVGDGIDAAIITGNRSNHTGYSTFRSATFGVSGDGFIAKGITFENTAGPEEGQVVALRSNSVFSVFYLCSFKGYQDTLYVHSNPQFYRECDIYGTVDFIFGDAAVVLQNCNIYVRKPKKGQKNTITAQGKNSTSDDTGIVIHYSSVKASSELRPVQPSFKSYLGRPWGQYSTTLFIKTSIDDVIDPAGWLPWDGEYFIAH